MEFLIDIGLFAGKASIIVFSLLLIMIVFSSLILRHKTSGPQLEIKDLGKKWDSNEETLLNASLSKKELKGLSKTKKASHKAKEKADKKKPPKIHKTFVLDFDGDIKASAVKQLRDEITYVLGVAKEEDEVFVRLESGGGMVHGYGLAAAQLLRIRDKKIPLTISVDKVAASGGYMMACTANKIIAAPFAILGSIGVIAQVPNFNRLLKKHDIDYQEITSGEYKRTVSLLGEITDKGREKFTADIKDTHDLFKTFVGDCRPQLNLEEVSTGEHWFGLRAIDRKLTDQLKTSDEYLAELRKQKRKILSVQLRTKKSLGEKLSQSANMTLTKLVDHVLERNQKNFL